MKIPPPLVRTPVPMLRDIILFLKSTGWLPDAVSDDAPLTITEVKDATVNFQKFHGLVPDGVFGPVCQRMMVLPRCALADRIIMPADCKPQWAEFATSGQGVTVTQDSMAFSTMGSQQVHETWLAALKSWSDVCGIIFTYVPWSGPGSANIWARAQSIDGANNTLAWSYLPGCGEPQTTELEQRYDVAEQWYYTYLLGVMTHELGHAIGLNHTQDQADIMYPYMRSNIYTPQPGDVSRVQTRYGMPAPPPDPGPDPEPPIVTEHPSHVGMKWNDDDSTAVWCPLGPCQVPTGTRFDPRMKRFCC